MIKISLSLSEEKLEEMWNEGNDDYSLVEEGEWFDEGKQQYASNTYKDSNGKFWSMNASKSGSYFSHTEYYYDNEIVQVEKKQKLVDYWAII